MRLLSLSKSKSEVSGQSGHYSARLLAMLRARTGCEQVQQTDLLDHLVREREQFCRDFQRERLSSFAIKDEF